MSPGNIYASYTHHLDFINCTFSKLGTTGLDLRIGNNNSQIYGCKFIDISGNALQVGSVDDISARNKTLSSHSTLNIIIMNNYITNCSADYMAGCGIFAGYIRDSRIEHNSISNLPYTGISLGWGWSAQETVSGNNTVKYNHLYGIMNFLKDGGAIYTLSTSPGTNISYNVIHDCGWNALYPDQRTNQTTWSYNVVWDVENSFHDHSKFEEGHWNNISNNYLETYPKSMSTWYPERDEDQIFGLSPGDSDFPSDIVNDAGVESEYSHLIPENEVYWQYERTKSQFNWKIFVIVSTAAFLGIIIIWNTKDFIRKLLKL